MTKEGQTKKSRQRRQNQSVLLEPGKHPEDVVVLPQRLRSEISKCFTDAESTLVKRLKRVSDFYLTSRTSGYVIYVLFLIRGHA